MEAVEHVGLDEIAAETFREDSGMIGPYVILDKIGSGGMGDVYKVRHRGAGTLLAMKILRHELITDPINVKRFQQELKTTSSLTHANVVPIYDSGIADDGRPYFVMEFLDGCTLEEILQEEGFLDLERFLHIFGQVCDALIQAHEKRIVHRDLKPSNIMITVTDSGFELVKVVDFGIARVFQKASKDGARLTQLGDVLGSPLYMSPEQCLSQKLDERSDIYSLAVVMYEALAGVPPFPGDNAVEIIMGHLQKRPASINAMRPDFNIPPDLENLVFTCLEKEPALRTERLHEVAEELKRISLSVKSRTPFRALKQWPRRIKFRVQREFRRLADKQNSLRPALLAISLAGVTFFAYQQYQRPSINQLIERAQAAILTSNVDKVNDSWKEVLEMAAGQQVERHQMALYFEQAADDLVSSPTKSCMLSGNYNNWQMMQNWNSDSNRSLDAKCAHLAKPYLERALELTPRNADRLRVLDKIITLASSQQDIRSEELYLKERVDLTVNDTNPAERLAEIYMSQGRDQEAEEIWTKQLRVEEAQHNSPFPQSMEKLAEIHRVRHEYAAEEKLRTEICEDIKTAIAAGNNYTYQLREQLLKLSTCVRRLNRPAQADRLALEASKLKDR